MNEGRDGIEGLVGHWADLSRTDRLGDTDWYWTF
jgi:hypothetical protein